MPSSVEDIADAYQARLGIKALAHDRDARQDRAGMRTQRPDTTSWLRSTWRPRIAGRHRGDRQASLKRRKHRARAPVDHPEVSFGALRATSHCRMVRGCNYRQIFLTDIGKEGSTLRGMMNSFATAVFYPPPVRRAAETLVRKFSYMRFAEPGGHDLQPGQSRSPSRMPYYIMWLASRFLDTDLQEELGDPHQEGYQAAQDAPATS